MRPSPFREALAPVRLLATDLAPLPVDEVAAAVAAWAAAGESRVVCCANVHMLMEAWDDPGFAAVLDEADLVVCDGRPLVWACRLLGRRDAAQARGLDVLHAACSVAARRGLRVGLYGGRPQVTAAVRARLEATHRGLVVAAALSPPFRELTPREEAADLAALREAGVQVLFVSLGCPRQERWMLAHREDLPTVQVGVGAAFDMLAGALPVAPRWAQRLGLEWLLRLASEPRRLWRRYARHNWRFVREAARQVTRQRLSGRLSG